MHDVTAKTSTATGIATIRQPRLLIAAPSSSSGKTTVTCSLLMALQNLGLRPLAAKCGPDYVDPIFHRQVLGVPSCNVDLFFLSPERVRALLAYRMEEHQADITIIEGVMGYYDGIAGGSDASSWHVATATETPVILVVDAKGMALSVAAQIAGYQHFRTPSHLAGVLLNHCSSSLYALLAPMIEAETGLTVFGYVPHMEQAQFSSRHLGLNIDENQNIAKRIAMLATEIARTIRLDDLLDVAASAPALTDTWNWPARITDIRPRIAVAHDEAFCFCYPENMDTLQALGAELTYFSPLHDTNLPPGTQGVYLVGGYPELRAAKLSENTPMLLALRKAFQAGIPTIAECGGFMYLHSALEAPDGTFYPQVGAIPGRAFATQKLQRFGYATLHTENESPLLPKGYSWPVHEFHYWDSDYPGHACLATKPASSRSWNCMVARDTLLAGFPHHYFPACPEVASRFVQHAAAWDMSVGRS